MNETPTTDEIVRREMNDPKGEPSTLAAKLTIKSCLFEAALRAVMNTPQFYDMADDVQEQVKKSLARNERSGRRNVKGEARADSASPPQS